MGIQELYNLPLYEMDKLIESSIELGISRNELKHNPSRDRLKHKDAKEWFERLGYKIDLLDFFIQKNLVRTNRSGISKNSYIYYSIFEIQKAIANVEICKIIKKYSK